MYRKEKQIELAAFSMMRGRTFKRSFIIADEIQNCNKDAVMMLLTRLGEGSCMVLTGDPTQRDLAGAGGYEHAHSKLNNIEGIRFVEFGEEDVVRHPLVKRIIQAW